MNRLLQTVLLLIIGLQAGSLPAEDSEPVSFEKVIQPLLQQRCLSCHNDTARKGELSLSTRKAASAGGASGEVIVPGKSKQSYLLDLVTPDEDGKSEMPKGGPPLTSKEISHLKTWIASGAEWPAGITLQEPVWWSLAPLKRQPVPVNEKTQQHPVDAFLSKKLGVVGLQYSKPADRRTLIRRLYFDLIGLPPTPEEINRFVKNTDENAYAFLVDELLASPRYGERWARHWLDVVHYGDTHGYDKDKPRPNAWPYRDYVIRAFNDDKPYGRFVQEQVAGDVLFPNTQDGIEALGFIAAGPWDFIGHAEVPETKIDGKIARHLDRDDMVQNTMNTFLSLTVGCAQCHDHKFDPITQKDYYSLHAIFAAVDRADKPYYADADLTQQYVALIDRQRSLKAEQQKLNSELAAQAGSELVELDQKLKTASSQKGKRPVEYGYHSQISRKQDVVKWVQLNFEKPVTLSALELFGCDDDFNQIGPGFGFPLRFKVEASNSADFSNPTLLIDQTQDDYLNPGTAPRKFLFPAQSVAALRITATKLAPRQNDFIFSLAEVKLFSPEEELSTLSQVASLSTLDSIEAPPRWALKNLTDGLYPAATDQSELIARLEAERHELIRSKVDAKVKKQIAAVNEELKQTQASLDQLPAPNKVYAGTVHYGSGSFTGTGNTGGTPRPIHLLLRGNVTTPGDLVEPAALPCVSTLDANFNLPEGHSEGERRAALARWLTDSNNPLLWRSIANRVWQYHFGNGIVNTPDDFGRMGELPLHPELLDWLSCELRDNGQSLKHLHRLIVTSNAYQQVSDLSNELIDQAIQLDPDNRLLWRMNRRQLEAEAVRDSILSVAGRLDLTMYGPGFQDFVIEKPQHSPHYQYELYDPEDASCHRRAVYRFLVRSKTQPFMTVMDCADPSMRVGKRTQSLSPLQALAMLNNGLALTMEKYFAERVRELTSDPEKQVETAFQLGLGREPNDIEKQTLVELTQQHGLENTCRVIFNLNEFLFID